VNAEPLIEWPQPLLELLGFIAAFLSVGAVGFRFGAMRGWTYGPASDEGAVHRLALSRSALLGLIGALLGAGLLGMDLPEMAARRHVEVSALVLHTLPVTVQVSLRLLAILGFLIALAGGSFGWTLAGIGVIAGMVRNAFFGQWGRLANPMHELGAAMWIGTLFVLMVAGIRVVLSSRLPADRRGEVVADLVRSFSPLALGSVAVLAFFGVNTAWQHLHTLDALWTTPYGKTLIVKLCVVLGVVALGAWNWRRQKPKLGDERAANSLAKSALAELALASVVLLITAVLVSLPSPRRPGEGRPGSGPPAAGAPPSPGASADTGHGGPPATP
jgi:putative copper export protein